jgi:hypothetical protein
MLNNLGFFKLWQNLLIIVKVVHYNKYSGRKIGKFRLLLQLALNLIQFKPHELRAFLVYYFVEPETLRYNRTHYIF